MKRMKKNLKIEKGLNYSPRNNHVPKGAKLKLPKRATMFLGENSSFFSNI
jgi:hypothetical protein